MRPSEALTAHRAELRQLVSHNNLARPRVFGSVLTGLDTEKATSICWLIPATRPRCLRWRAWSFKQKNCLVFGFPFSRPSFCRRNLVPYQPTRATFCAESYRQKSHKIIAGTIIVSAIRLAAAVAARPSLVR